MSKKEICHRPPCGFPSTFVCIGLQMCCAAGARGPGSICLPITEFHATLGGLAARPQKRTYRFLHRRRDAGFQRSSRYFGCSTVRFEERNAIWTLSQVAPKTQLLFLGKVTLDVVETVFDELITADHDIRSMAAYGAGYRNNTRRWPAEKSNLLLPGR